MKTCNFCNTEHEDTVIECCGYEQFTPVAIEENPTKDELEAEKVVPVQPAAHELLVELVGKLDLDDLGIEEDLPGWITDIPYEDVRASAKEKYLAENPTLVERIKKYLG